jgi:hypothetical protein
METKFPVPDLYRYLLSLASTLDQAGQPDLAKRARFVSDFASGSSSELGEEAQAFLSELLKHGAPGLSTAEVALLREVLDGIAEEFRRIGGA